MKELITFAFQEHKLRVIEHRGEPWFIANEVCTVLGIANSWDAVSRLSQHQRDALGISDAIGRIQKTNIISEGGFYKLAFRSNKPEAEAFTDLVVDTILPSIRKTGGYIANEEELLKSQLGMLQFAEDVVQKIVKSASARHILDNPNRAVYANIMLEYMRTLFYRSARDYRGAIKLLHGESCIPNIKGDVVKIVAEIKEGRSAIQLQFPFEEDDIA